jgi:dienelactone hydrolase
MKRRLRPSLAVGIFLACLAGMATTPVDVAIDGDGVILEGKLFAAQGPGPFATVILLHGFPSDEVDVLGIGGKLAEAGFNALTFNFGGSYQRPGESSMPNAQREIQAAFDFIRRQENAEKYKVDRSRIVLGGWCFGGGMALGYAVGHDEVTAVFSIAGNDHGEFLREYSRNPEFQKLVDGMFASWTKPPYEVRFAKGALPKEIAAAGLDQLDPIFDLRASAPRLAGKEILLVGGWNDRQVTIDRFILPFYRALEKAGAKNVTIIAFQDDHYFKKSREPLARAVIDWLKSIQAIR